MTFSDAGVSQLLDEAGAVKGRYVQIQRKLVSFKQTHPTSSEHTIHGLLRRLGTLERCIQNVYQIYAPYRSDIPTHEMCIDLGINIQSFIFNVFGCLDNLAWIWVIERQIKGKNGNIIKETQVGFRKNIVISTFSDEFRDYVHGLNQWFCYLDGFRHGLAHRIPLYIVPFTVTPDNEDACRVLELQKAEARMRGDFELLDELDAAQTELGKFRPIMTHSLYSGGSAPIYFHSQMLCDWNTVTEIVDRFLLQPGW